MFTQLYPTLCIHRVIWH